MSTEARYYYVDAQNQAAGPIAMPGLLALKAAGTVTDATLVVLEGGAEWVTLSTLKTEGASKGGAVTLNNPAPVGAAPSGAEALQSSAPVGVRSDGGPSAVEPSWASTLSQKIDQLTASMEKLVTALEKARPSSGASAASVPATAALHAEKINLNPTPKPGIAALNPATNPAGASPLPRPGIAAPLAPLAVPANAQKSALPLPALGKTPGAAPAGTPTVTPAPAPAKGNIFSKFLKK